MRTGPIVKIGRYEVKDKIAAGGMATVYRAVQTGIGGFKSLVALKILHPHLAQDPQFKKMFLEEARLGALLSHRCLLSVLDYGEEEGVSYLVSEYFPSMSVEELVGKAKRLPIHESLFVLAEAAEGLHALHEAKDLEGKRLGLVHRDVSPHNILVGMDGRVKLIDFGIVKKNDPTERTVPGVVKGKVRYMAPEQAAGRSVDARCDVYALALVFLRMVTGSKPHGSGATGEMMARARAGLDLEPVLKKLRLPEAAEDLLRRMLAVKPDDRPSDALTVARQAREILSVMASSYDVHSFTMYLEGVKNRDDRKNGSDGAPAEAGGAAGERGKAGRKGSDSPHPGSPSDSGASQTIGIHPKWLFLALLGLFAAALVAYLAR